MGPTVGGGSEDGEKRSMHGKPLTLESRERTAIEGDSRTGLGVWDSMGAFLHTQRRCKGCLEWVGIRKFD